jgi:glycosyltransferase involved in cell wall biosynthesis
VQPGDFAGCNVVAHEWLTSAAGSDKVAAELVELSGAAALVCLSARPEVIEALGISVPVHQSRVGRWAESGNRWHLLLPLMPVIWGSLPMAGVDTVVTSSHSLVNSLPVAGRRVCYCHTPVRYGWEWRMERDRLPRRLQPLLRPGSAVLRWWDRRMSQRVDVYVANSAFVAGRIRRAYGRSATVVHPPIDTDRFTPGDGQRLDEFLVAGRMVAYKRADIAVRAATQANVALAVAGRGPEWERLRDVAGPTVRFVESPSDDDLVELMRHAKAVIHCGIEDFGMVLVEAQACGAPVLARADGGAVETVDLAVSGVLVDSERVVDWAAAMSSFSDPGSASARRCWALTFSSPVFRCRMREILEMAGTGSTAR